MNLSNIGHFEVNILDINKNLEVTFYSDSDKVREFFDSNSEELILKLTKQNLTSVKIKSQNVKVSENVSVLDQNNNNLNSSSTIDIII